MTHHPTGGLWLPLTLAQLDFWEEFRFHPTEAVSTVAHVIELRDVADPQALARAITDVIAECDVMALRFRLDPDGVPMQCIDPARRPALRRIDLSGEADPHAAGFALMRADLDQPLDLLCDPLAAQWLILLGPGHYLWMNRGHHIALDGYAMGLIERRCARLYAAHVQGTDPGPPLGRLAAYLHEETDYRASPRHARDGQHWAQVLDQTPRPQVLRKGAENYPAQAREAHHDLTALRPALMAQAQATGMGWPDLLTALCAAWTAITLQDGSAARDMQGCGTISMPVWLPYMSRMGSVSATVPALVVNILPLDVRLHPDAPLAQILAHLTMRMRALRRHGRYRIEQIAADWGVAPRSRFFFSPLINVLPFDEAVFADCPTRRHVLSNGPGDGFNLTIRGDGAAQGLDLWIEADPALTPADRFAQMAGDLPRFLAAALQPDALSQPVSALPGCGVQSP